ncbi:Diguanylate cyclase DosC [Magnetospirillum gryphiswaldense MSR-1]|nr:Diguanylate cyclase DosC [Magnetospirillum gryphiswaldense MSR-1]AVM76524.1 Diguanylate cyclase DosC [Magnetospirillum gryphiswaldense]
MVFVSVPIASVAAQTTQTPASSARIVRIQLKWTHQFQFAGFYAALEQGYFREAGLDVRLLPGGPHIDPAQVVVGGGAEFGIGNSSLLINHAWGAPVVAVAAILQHSPFVLAAIPSLDEPKSLAGRRLMLEAHSAELQAYLHLAGVDMTQVRLMPHSGDIRDLGHKVDAASAYSSDETYTLLTDKIGHQIFNPRSIGMDFYGDTLFTSARLAAENPDLVRAVREAVIKGWYHALEHPNQAMRLINDKYAPDIDPLKLRYEAEEIRRLMDADVVGIGYMNVKRWDGIAAAFQRAGLIATPVDLAAFLFDAETEPDLGWVYTVLAVGGIFVLVVATVAAQVVRLNRRLRREIEERRRLEQILTHQAMTDPLTGLCNRRHFILRANEELHRARRTGAPLAVLYLDVDHFKTINDNYGHGLGDQVLVTVARACRDALGGEDLLARMGGEEFAAVLPGQDKVAAQMTAERLRRCLGEVVTRSEDGRLITITISIGVATLADDDGDMLTVLDRADRALYQAKTLGRNRSYFI